MSRHIESTSCEDFHSSSLGLVERSALFVTWITGSMTMDEDAITVLSTVPLGEKQILSWVG
jgi:hypothetical protein